MFVAQESTVQLGGDHPATTIPATVVPIEKAKKKRTSKAKKKKANNVDISRTNPHYMSPDKFVIPCRELLGGFDLDVASCARANEIIQAKKYFSPELGTCGLQKQWGHRGKGRQKRVWCNPPGGVVIWNDKASAWEQTRGPGESFQNLFLQRFREQWAAGHCYGFFLSFNHEAVCKYHGDLFGQIPYLMPRKRTAYQDWKADQGEFITEKSPRKYSILLFFPPKDKALARQLSDQFMADFAQFGHVYDPTATITLALEDIARQCHRMDSKELGKLLGILKALHTYKLAEERQLSPQERLQLLIDEGWTVVEDEEDYHHGHMSSCGGFTGHIEKKSITPGGEKKYGYLRYMAGSVYKSIYLGIVQ